MTQLILNNKIYLPETRGDRYRSYPKELTQAVDMISGRRVLERRGKVQYVEYSCDYLGNDLMRQVLAVLRSGQPFPAAYLPDSGDALLQSVFITEEITQPTYAFSRNGIGLWHDFGFTIREVQPHD